MGRRSIAAGAALLTLAALCAPQGASGQAVQSRPDVLPDVTVRARPAPDQVDVALSRFPRARGCFDPPDVWNRDPSAKFNQAYYEELTGDAGHYDKIRLPPPKRKFYYPAPIHRGENMFRNLDAIRTEEPDYTLMYQPDKLNAEQQLALRFTAAKCGARSAAETDTRFARALAMYDKGDFAGALPALETAYVGVRRTVVAGEIALMVASMYMRGEGAPRDVPKAIGWFKKAVEAPNAGARGNPRYNPETPDRYYTIAAEGAARLGLIYLRGDGVPKDEAAARQWVEVAMRNNHVPAMKAAADMYYAGYGGPKNLRNALMQYEAAGEVRHAGALFAAAEMRDLGEGASPDRKKAVRLYAMAGQLGSMPATYALAVAYDKGDGVPANPEQALTLYKIAALGGNGPAQTAIGTYFYEGGSVLGKDLAAARDWFGEAAQTGDADGMVNLAAMLIRGEGGEVDLVRAYAWLAIAGEIGREDARAGLAGLEGRMTATDLASAKALLAG